jgi:hypothetical protein
MGWCFWCKFYFELTYFCGCCTSHSTSAPREIMGAVATALMEGCGKVELEDCNHAAFVPTAGKSLLLPDTYKWYGSAGLIDEWVSFL